MEMRDRVLDALKGNGDSSPPAGIFTQTATLSSMAASGHSWPSAHTDAQEMAALALQSHTRFGFPTVRVPFDMTLEAEGFSCGVDLGSPGIYPSVSVRPFDFDGDLPDLCAIPDPVDFATSGRRAVVCDAVESLVGKGDFVAIAGVLGPFTTLVQMFGAETVIMATLLEPDALKTWLDAVQPCLTEFARTLSESGADVILLNEGSVSPDIASPSDFTTYVAERVRGFCFPGSVTGLHICGDTSSILEKMSASGAGFLSIDSKVDPEFVASVVGHTCPLVGAVDPTISLLYGSVADVLIDAWGCADSGFSVIAPGCGVPPGTPDENLLALARYSE